MRQIRFNLEKSYEKPAIFKLGSRIVILLVCFFLAFNPVIIPIIYAEELTETEQTSETIPDQTQGVDNTLVTGDAESSSDTQTTANVTQTEIPGEITSPTDDCFAPEGGTTCPTGTIIQDKTADITDSGSSDAQTGSNISIITEGDINLSTGDATASGSIKNDINQNLMLIVTPEATPSAEATPSGEPSLVLINNNDGTVTNTLTVNADTGLNLAQGSSGNIDLTTGDALALGNVFNALNLNFLGSEFQLLVLNISQGSGDINLNQTWKEVLEGEDNKLELASGTDTNYLTLSIYNNNLASLGNQVSINANSGQNQALEDDGNVGVSTGSSTALGNVVNLVNGNIVGSKILFVIINIFNTFQGNLIVPRPQSFQNGNGEVEGIFSNNNSSLIDDSVKSKALSGENSLTTSGDSTLETGKAKSVSNSMVLTNLTYQGNNQYSMLINNLGEWSGYICGWGNPGSEEAVDFQSRTLNAQPQATSADSAEEETTYPIDVVNNNLAEVQTDLDVSATTGLNEVSAGGNSKVKTGNALALANLFDLINFNIFGSRLFLGLINNLGNWSGNYISAFPDTAVTVLGPEQEVTPGSDVSYTVTYKNQGQDPAPNTVVTFRFPKGASFIADSSGLPVTQSGGELIWNLGELKEGASGSFEVKLHLDPNLKPDDLLSFWNKLMDKLVTTAYAAEGGKTGTIVVNVSIATSDDQSKTDNDSSSATTEVFFPDSPSSSVSNSSQGSLEQTTILMTAKNNVNQFVYPGDTVIYQLTAKNIGGVIAKNVTVSQRMYDGGPQDMGTINFPVGDINPGQVIEITFGLALSSEIAPDIYYTESYAAGENATSSVANTQFEVKANSISLVPVALAQEKQEEESNAQVLGETTCPVIKPKKEWLPWVLTTVFATLWFVEYSRRKGWIEDIRKRLERK